MIVQCKKELLLFLCIVSAGLIFAFGCGGSGGNDNGGGDEEDDSDVSVTFLPTGNSVAVDAAVTATFDDDIDDTSIAVENFTLIKEDDDETNCKSVTYENKVATCTHDPLEMGATYTITLSGVKDADGKTIATQSAEFTVTTRYSVILTTKTSVNDVNNGDGIVELTFTFNAPLPDTITPSVELNLSETDAEVSALQDCPLDSDRTICTIEFEGLDGCKTYTDYTVLLIGDDIDYFEYTFNSADDEFLEDNFTQCYENQTINGDVNEYIANGAYKVSAEDDESASLIKPAINENSDIAISTMISSITRPTNGEGLAIFALRFQEENDYNNEIELLDGYINSDVSGETFFDPKIWIFSSFPNVRIPNETGDFEGMTDGDASIYFCLVKHNGEVNGFVSNADMSWITLTEDNTTESLGSFPIPFPFDVAITPQLSVNNQLTSGEGILSATIDYFRFKSFISDGTSADCPEF
jgi:hypothetical protein